MNIKRGAKDKYRRLIEQQLEEVLDALDLMVMQHCGGADGYANSMFISANANAIEVLVKHGRMEFVQVPSGRLVVAKSTRRVME